MSVGERIKHEKRTDTDSRPLLLLIGSGDQVYRRYIIASVSQRYRLWLLEPTPATWQQPYITGSTVVDNTNIELVVETARDLASQMKVHGVFCYDEGLILPASYVAEALGLIGMTPEAVKACRDKHNTRTALDKAGVPQAISLCVSSYQEAREAVEAIGYPIVLKPRGLSGSKGVIRIDCAEDLEAGYRTARAASYPGVPVYDAGVLVEEYLDGPEISIDSVSFQGRLYPMILARKQVSFDPFFEEVGHVVRADDPLLKDVQILDILEKCLQALGIRDGIAHTELRLTSRGPKIIEVNARLGGDLIPYIGGLANGIDAPMAAADVTVGHAPDVTIRQSQVSAIKFLYPVQDCRVVSVNVNDNIDMPSIYKIGVTTQPGEELCLPPRGYLSRYGFVIAVGQNEKECLDALEQADKYIELQMYALEVTEAKS